MLAGPAVALFALDTPAGAPDACISIGCGTDEKVERPVLRMGHPELRRVAEPVAETEFGTARIASLVEDLWDTMAARAESVWPPRKSASRAAWSCSEWSRARATPTPPSFAHRPHKSRHRASGR